MCGFLLYTLLLEFSYNFSSFHSDNKPVPKKSDGNASSGVNTEVVKKNVPHSTSADNVVKASQTTKPKHSEVSVDPPTSFHHTLSDLRVAVMASVDKIPTPEESQKYLEEIAMLKKSNAQVAMLNIIDEIMDLTLSDKIGEAELETDIPDSIVASIHDRDYSTEYIKATITKKWVEHRFLADREKYVINVKSLTLVEVVDTETQTFDLFGLVINYSSTKKRNRISPEFIAKGEPVNTKPRQVGSYSTFRGSQAVKHPLIPVIPTVQPTAPKVS